MNSNALYFGYGANKSLEMMLAIVGRRPSGKNFTLENYELFIHEWKDISEQAKEILKNHWNETFCSYAIRPKKGRLVNGTLWELTRKERNFVGEWELHGIWYKPITLQIEDKSKKILDIETEYIDDYNPKAVNGISYPIFLNNPEKMFRVANYVRENISKNKR